jgi:hypothetical protein
MSIATAARPTDMRASLHHLGDTRTPVVTIDDVWGDTAPLIEIAAGLGSFPPAANSYPGLRRAIGSADEGAFAYVNALLERAAAYICRAFRVTGFRIADASFSLITTPATDLATQQRAPHFDCVESNRLALLHYLVPTAGTAFYRHRATGIEHITADVVERYVDIAKTQAAATPARYVTGSNEYYEQIGMIEGHRDRLAIYPGNLLHSAVIASDASLSDDPRTGRITSNIFVTCV